MEANEESHNLLSVFVNVVIVQIIVAAANGEGDVTYSSATMHKDLYRTPALWRYLTRSRIFVFYLSDRNN